MDSEILAQTIHTVGELTKYEFLGIAYFLENGKEKRFCLYLNKHKLYSTLFFYIVNSMDPFEGQFEWRTRNGFNYVRGKEGYPLPNATDLTDLLKETPESPDFMTYLGSPVILKTIHGFVYHKDLLSWVLSQKDVMTL